MKRVFIIEAKRTAIGNFCGSLASIKPQDMSAVIISNILLTHQIDQRNISKVIIGHVLECGFGQNTARQAAVKANIGYHVPAFVVNQVCGSGLKSVMLACQDLQADGSELIIAGGHENMSMAPHYVRLRSEQNKRKLGDEALIDSVISDGLMDVFENYHMGVTAENIAQKYKISRLDQDKYALSSQQKATEATKLNYFKNEIVPIEIKNHKNEIISIFDKDEFIKENTSLEILSKLKPAFLKDGTVTAGNSSGINDSSSILLIATEEASKKYGLKPIAEIVSYSEVGVEPKFMGIAPVNASKKALEKAGWSINALDLIEINEAFASQMVAVINELRADQSKLNINGGAIALGHPIGASGARCLTTLIHAMKRKKVEKGLVSLCIGGGLGVAMCVKNL
jgi:acetyl-CoA C-acetyltransferase